MLRLFFFRNLSAVLPFWQEFSERLKRCLVKGLDLQGLAHDFMELSLGWTPPTYGRLCVGQHAGYACHENLLPVHQHGSFTPKTAEDYFQLFLLWQDHLHRKPHHWGGKGCGNFAFRWRGTCHSVNVAVSGTGAKSSARSTMTNNVDKLQFWYLSFIFTARVRTDLT